MKVEVRLFATLAAFLPAGSSRDTVVLDLPPGATVGDVLRQLRIPQHVECLRFVNGRDAPHEYRLSEGDVVTVCPPLVGG